MPVAHGRLSAVVIAPLAMILVLSLVVPAFASAAEPPGLSRFMRATARVESGGRYSALNATSGAYGKYQIMPASWLAWAGQYLGDPRAPRSAVNQERVARAKMTSLFHWLGSWRRVAYWWLTGSSATSGWTPAARAYVARVMTYYRGGTGRGSTRAPATVTHVSERSASIHYTGRWATASSGGYAGGQVRYATRSGATATVSFSGTRILWYGPVGPTRGHARVLVDHVYVKTVDLHRASFAARDVLFSASWPTTGRHTLTIEVVGTKGHPLVAIDEFVVAR